MPGCGNRSARLAVVQMELPEAASRIVTRMAYFPA